MCSRQNLHGFNLSYDHVLNLLRSVPLLKGNEREREKNAKKSKQPLYSKSHSNFDPDNNNQSVILATLHSSCYVCEHTYYPCKKKVCQILKINYLGSQSVLASVISYSYRTPVIIGKAPKVSHTLLTIKRTVQRSGCGTRY